ncbi:GIY-YIG nuclease family protein [Streptomyces antimycoticus]|uniref:GIY-YIG nuclease family protein n=1 Tax=Streptomyces antimycoticus TaxID=68175 RepID=UPI000A38D30F|nr:GIY-YIG nuclease family protein [Streptomyces antimycoticus]
MTNVPEQRSTSVEPAYHATLQHIQLLQARQHKLVEAQENVEDQILYHYGSSYRCGDVTITELLEFFEAYRALETPRRTRRWNNHIDLPYQTCHLMKPPNGPEGTWSGTWPCPETDPCPLRGVAVVYVLFDARNEPCYLGSTDQFRTRIGKHVKDGKVFTSWQAYPCPDREAAYVLEDRLLKERLPSLNKKAGR